MLLLLMLLTVHVWNRKARTAFSEDHVKKLEQWIDEMDDDLPPLTAFILPVRTNLKFH